MNRFSRESMAAGGRSAPAGSPSPASALLIQQRRRSAGAGAAAAGRDGGDEGLDLFSRSRRSLPVIAAPAEEESEVQIDSPKLGSLSAGAAKLQKSGMDDLLLGADMGKHDYDWLLTPPGTPLVSSLDGNEHQLSSLASRNRPSRTTVSTIQASRFSAPETENNHVTKPTRSSSITRPSFSSTYSNHVSTNSNRTSVLNTSTASITSSRPVTPSRRSIATPTTCRQSAPVSRLPSRPSTPVKSHSNTSSDPDKTRSLHGTRPSIPTSRSQITAVAGLSSTSNSNSIAARSVSRPSTPTHRALAPSSTSVPTRPSTPTRRTPATSASVPTRSSTPTRRPSAPSLAPVAARPSTPTRRTPAPVISGRSTAPSSRASSPSPKTRVPVPLILPDFPHDVPPNLRTKLPERPSSAGRSRSGAALTVRANVNSETASVPSIMSGRRSSSPIVTRSRFPENSPKSQLHSSGHETTPPETQKPMASYGAVRKPIKQANTTESTGFGRNISKKSLDMALKHMDIRQGVGGIRGASLFPQSIRSTALKSCSIFIPDPTIPISSNGTDTEDTDRDGTVTESCNGAISENGDSITMSPDRDYLIRRTIEPDVYESSRYDVILLKEDLKSMNWLHSIEDKSDQGSVFDHRFEPLPEPFGLI